MSKRAIIWSVGVLSVLLVAVIIALVVLIATINKQANDAAYTACVRQMTTGTNSVSELARAAEFCSH